MREALELRFQGFNSASPQGWEGAGQGVGAVPPTMRRTDFGAVPSGISRHERTVAQAEVVVKVVYATGKGER